MAFQDGTVLAVQNPKDGLITYGVLRDSTSRYLVNKNIVQLSSEETEQYLEQFRLFTRLSEANLSGSMDTWDSSGSGPSSIDDMFNGPGWVKITPSGSGGAPEGVPEGFGSHCGVDLCL